MTIPEKYYKSTLQNNKNIDIRLWLLKNLPFKNKKSIAIFKSIKTKKVSSCDKIRY